MPAPPIRPGPRRGPRLRGVLIAAGLAVAVVGAGFAYASWARRVFLVTLHVWPHGRIAQIDGDASGADLQDGTVHLLKVRRGAHKVMVELHVPTEKEPRRRTVTIDAGGDGFETISLLTPEEMNRLLAITMRHDPFLAGAP
jgi:hypothetical protein